MDGEVPCMSLLFLRILLQNKTAWTLSSLDAYRKLQTLNFFYEMARKTKAKALADRQKVEESKQKPLAKGAASPKVTLNPKKKGHQKENILKIKGND